MDRSDGRKLKNIFNKISSKELVGAELQESKLIYNVVGFIPISDSTDNSILISNLGMLLAEKGLNVCVLDFKVFYPNLYLRYDLEPNKKGDGLIKLLKSDKANLKEEIRSTKYDNLYVLSPSPQDLMEEYFDFNFTQIEKLIEQLKSTFDIVLIDVPNNPPLEFCVAGIKNLHVGFLTAGERIESLTNIIKFFNYLQSIGISTAKLSNVILMNTIDLQYDYQVFSEHGLNMVGVIPHVKAAYKYALENKLYLKEAKGFNKYFHKELHRLASELAEE